MAFGPAAAAPADGPAERYIDTQLAVVRGLDAQLDLLADAADAAVARLLAGGRIWLAGEPGMISELAGRAGGLCAAKPLPGGSNAPALTASDVVFFSDYGLPARQPLADAWARLVKTDALVLLFTSAENPLLKSALPANVRVIRLAIPADSRLLPRDDGPPLLSAAAPANATAQWAMVAELLGAGRRQQRQLAIYLSIHLDPGRERYQRTAGLLWEPDLKPAPVPRKQYAAQFLGITRDALTALRRDTLPTIRTAGARLAEAAAAKAHIYRIFEGHLPPSEAGRPGDVEWFTNAKPLRKFGDEGAAWARETLHAGDVLLLLGYQENEDAMADAANAVGARTIFFTSRGPSNEQRRRPLHIYVDPHWPVTDACLDLPGYDVKACPLSAIMGLTCYYGVCGEAVTARR